MKAGLFRAILVGSALAGTSPVVADDFFTNESTSLTAITMPELTEYERSMEETRSRITREQNRHVAPTHSSENIRNWDAPKSRSEDNVIVPLEGASLIPAYLE